MAIIKILLALQLKHSSCLLSADVNPMLNDQAIDCCGSARLLFVRTTISMLDVATSFFCFWMEEARKCLKVLTLVSCNVLFKYYLLFN
jgi:hypothetical protein